MNSLVSLQFLNISIILSGLFLVLSTITGTFAYLSIGVDIGVAPSFLSEPRHTELTLKEYNQELLSLYVNWIDHNAKVARLGRLL